jgi:hypothetical protein
MSQGPESKARDLALPDGVGLALEGTGFRLDLSRDTAEETDLEGGTDAVDGVPSGSPWPVTTLLPGTAGAAASLPIGTSGTRPKVRGGGG